MSLNPQNIFSTIWQKFSPLKDSLYMVLIHIHFYFPFDHRCRQLEQMHTLCKGVRRRLYRLLRHGHEERVISDLPRPPQRRAPERDHREADDQQLHTTHLQWNDRTSRLVPIKWNHRSILPDDHLHALQVYGGGQGKKDFGVLCELEPHLLHEES